MSTSTAQAVTTELRSVNTILTEIKGLHKDKKTWMRKAHDLTIEGILHFQKHGNSAGLLEAMREVTLSDEKRVPTQHTRCIDKALHAYTPIGWGKNTEGVYVYKKRDNAGDVGFDIEAIMAIPNILEFQIGEKVEKAVVIKGTSDLIKVLRRELTSDKYDKATTKLIGWLIRKLAKKIAKA